MIEYLYYAVPITEESGFELDKRIQMSWLAIGLYVFLRKSTSPICIEEIASQGYGTSRSAIVLVLNELIDQGLVKQQLVEVQEVQHEISYRCEISYRLAPNVPKIPCKQLIDEGKVVSFTAVGIFCYLAKSEHPVSFDCLDKLSKVEFDNDISDALEELVTAGLIEEIEGGAS